MYDSSPADVAGLCFAADRRFRRFRGPRRGELPAHRLHRAGDVIQQRIRLFVGLQQLGDLRAQARIARAGPVQIRLAFLGCFPFQGC